MKRLTSTWCIASAIGLVGYTNTAWSSQDADTLSVRTLAATCANCHGTDGRPPSGSLMPPLAGLPSPRFLARMNEFKAGAGGATVMPSIAKGFDDRQIEQLAKYFSQQALRMESTR